MELYQFYNKHAADYDKWQYTSGLKNFQELEKEFLIKHISPHSRLIDIGCGTGGYIASISDKQCEIIAVYFVKQMIERAKQKADDEVKFICADAVSPG